MRNPRLAVQTWHQQGGEAPAIAEKKVDSDFFNKFEDDFDESDMKPTE